METVLDGPHQPPLSCGKPKYLVVLLHEAGVDGDAVLELALDWAPTLGKAEFLAPHGPWPGRQWARPAEGPAPAHPLEAAAAALDDYLDALLAKRKLGEALLALVGFGEGAALALAVGLRRPQAVGAVVAVGGGLDETFTSADALRSRPPVLLVEAATASGLSAPEHTERQLRDWGVAVQRVAKPGDYHGLDDDGITLIADFLHKALVPSAGEAE